MPAAAAAAVIVFNCKGLSASQSLSEGIIGSRAHSRQRGSGESLLICTTVAAAGKCCYCCWLSLSLSLRLVLPVTNQVEHHLMEGS